MQKAIIKDAIHLGEGNIIERVYNKVLVQFKSNCAWFPESEVEMSFDEIHVRNLC